MILGGVKNNIYTGLDGVEYPLYVSNYDKEKKNFEIPRKIIDHYDLTTRQDSERVKKMQENLNLHSGRWKSIENLSTGLQMQIGSENFNVGSHQIKHYPLIDRVSKSIVSDMISRPLIPVIRDISSRSRNFRERIKIQKVRDFFNETIVEPYLDKISKQYDMQMGITDPNMLEVEQQKQRRSEIQKRFEKENPNDILDYIDNVTSPDELIGMAFLKEGMRHTELKEKFATGAEYAVTLAEEYYRMSSVNGFPNAEALNPMNVIWTGSQYVTDVQNGQFAKHTQYLTPEDAVVKYATELSKSEIKDLSKLYSDLPSNKDHTNSSNNRIVKDTLVDYFEKHPEVNERLNLKTREGQQWLQNIHRQLSRENSEGVGVRESFVTFRWTKRANIVERVVNGEIEVFIRDEHYKKNKLAGDIKIHKTIIPQIWRGTKLGTQEDCVYVDVGPRLGQYNSISNPFDVKLNIYGGEYNTLQNNTKPVSFIDLGKPWNYKYNVKMANMEKIESTNIGKVFLGTTTMKPKKWSWAQWYQSIFKTNIAIIANHNRGNNNLDSSIFRTVDFGRGAEIGNSIKELEYLEDKTVSSMYYSKQKIGNISPYATNQNINQGVKGVDRKLYTFFNRNRLIKEKFMSDFLQMCLYLYKDKKEIVATILDDYLKAHFEINYNTDEGSNYQLYVVDDFLESEKVRELRSLSLSFLQNGMKPSELVSLWETESVSDLKYELERIEKKKEKEEKERYERESKLIDKKGKQQQELEKSRQLFRQEENKRNNEAKVKMAELNSLVMSNAQDIDGDKVNDSLTKALAQIKSKEKIKEQELALKKELKNRELDIKEKGN